MKEAVWSTEARVMIHPFRIYRLLAISDESTSQAGLLLRRPILWLVAVAAFVSFTTSGRWVWFHVISTFIGWSFVPAYQILWIVIIVRFLRKPLTIAKTVDLFFAGQGPWLAFFTATGGICLFAPDVWPTFEWLLAHDLLAVAFGVTVAWSALLTFAFFKAGLGASTVGALLGTFGFYTGFDGTIIAWYVATDQLTPLLLGAG